MSPFGSGKRLEHWLDHDLPVRERAHQGKPPAEFRRGRKARNATIADGLVALAGSHVEGICPKTHVGVEHVSGVARKTTLPSAFDRQPAVAPTVVLRQRQCITNGNDTAPEHGGTAVPAQPRARKDEWYPIILGKNGEVLEPIDFEVRVEPITSLAQVPVLGQNVDSPAETVTREVRRVAGSRRIPADGPALG